MLLKIAVLAGDGIGPEVTSQAIRVLESVASLFQHRVELVPKNIGGAALLSEGDPLPHDTLQTCVGCGAVLLGAVGGPAFDGYPGHLRAEAGLLRLRRELHAFANLRPALCFAGLEGCSTLRPEVVKGTDILTVRELLGGIYFGEPRVTQGPIGNRSATDTMRYSESEIERIARMGFDLARARRRKLTSVDKANVLECSRLWRDVVSHVAHDYPDVTLSHMYVDSASMALVAHPTQFDVLLTENMFGDILSDEAGGVVGSLGMLPSASVGGPVGIYEPVHGSAPDIAGRGIANPLGAILSVALMLRYSFRLEAEARCVEDSVAAVLAAGARTRDLAKGGENVLSTTAMGDAVVKVVESRAPRGGALAS